MALEFSGHANEDNPKGTERLFTDGKFYTDIEYCESWGHDMETGASLSVDQYRKMNSAGRAILKAAHYMQSLEATNEEYPLQLSTGRRVYHFHTRTKTGRSKELQEAAPEPKIQISEEDAEKLGIKDGEDVVVKSRRGQVQMLAAVGDIEPGQTFIPFHFGSVNSHHDDSYPDLLFVSYFDSPDGQSRAANELTQGMRIQQASTGNCAC